MLFRFSEDFMIDSDSEPWSNEGLRLAFFGGPGSGKSWNVALFCEQWLKQNGTLVIFEPRAEYHTLKALKDMVVFGGPYNKDMDFIPSAPSIYAKAVVQDGVSIIFYTEEIEDEEKLIAFTSAFIRHLLKYNEVQKRPILLVMEESHEYAPMSTKGRIAPPWVYGRMVKAFKDCFLQGRKLNVSTIAVSPRPQEVNFTIRQLANLTFFGKFSPQDIGYVDRECLKVYRERGIQVEASKLLDLKTGEWLTIMGSQAQYIKVTEPRLTPHGAITPKLTYTAPKNEQTKKTIGELAKIISEALEKELKEKSEAEKLKLQVKDLQNLIGEKQKEIDRLNTTLEVAGKIRVETKVETKEIPPKEVIEDLKTKILSLFDTYAYASPTQPHIAVPPTRNTYQIWEPKLPNPCTKKILHFLTENAGMKFTKAEIAVKTGYSSGSGSFNNAISFLKRQKLIKNDGRLYWS